MRQILRLPIFLARDPRRTEVRFALATAAVAAVGAVMVDTNPLATAVCDGVAVLLGLIWWNARRFNRAQSEAQRIGRE